jgi:hypothetical protein
VFLLLFVWSTLGRNHSTVRWALGREELQVNNSMAYCNFALRPQGIQHALVTSLLSLLKPMNELFSIVVNYTLLITT